MRASYLYPSGQSTLADAKTRLNIHNLWKHFGFDAEPKISCHSPFRKDGKPSFSVNADGSLFNDFGNGDAGDAVDFFQRASGLSQKEACRKFIELAGGNFLATANPQRAAYLNPQVETKPKPVFPNFVKGTAEDFQHLANLRNIGREGLEWAGERGLLWFAKLKGCPSWIITDSKRVNAQARRMDGLEWEHIGAKAWTLPGSWAAWPIGIGEAGKFGNIALCEGGPDFLAAHYLTLHEQASHYARRDVQCSPVAMLGASQRIHADALPLFAGKRVRIYGHDDDAGKAAVELWARQLQTVVADVDAFNFAGLRQADGKPVKDLNDSLSMDEKSFSKVERMLPL